MESQSQNSSWAIPLAIVLAGALIAGAVYLSNTTSSINQEANVAKGTTTGPQPSNINLKPVSQEEHILGKADAKVVIVEYSDLECPYCQRYHKTVQQVMADYASSGDVAWVYRHFNVHSRAVVESEASECVAELGGNEAFFKYIDGIFAVSKADNNLSDALILKTATDLGIDETKFKACLDSGKYRSKVDQDTADAQEAGKDLIATRELGTPYTILVTKNGKYPIKGGAIPYAQLKAMIETLLKDLK